MYREIKVFSKIKYLSCAGRTITSSSGSWDSSLMLQLRSRGETSGRKEVKMSLKLGFLLAFCILFYFCYDSVFWNIVFCTSVWPWNPCVTKSDLEILILPLCILGAETPRSRPFQLSRINSGQPFWWVFLHFWFRLPLSFINTAHIPFSSASNFGSSSLSSIPPPRAFELILVWCILLCVRSHLPQSSILRFLLCMGNRHSIPWVLGKNLVPLFCTIWNRAKSSWSLGETLS